MKEGLPFDSTARKGYYYFAKFKGETDLLHILSNFYTDAYYVYSSQRGLIYTNSGTDDFEYRDHDDFEYEYYDDFMKNEFGK